MPEYSIPSHITLLLDLAVLDLHLLARHLLLVLILVVFVKLSQRRSRSSLITCRPEVREDSFRRDVLLLSAATASRESRRRRRRSHRRGPRSRGFALDGAGADGRGGFGGVAAEAEGGGVEEAEFFVVVLAGGVGLLVRGSRWRW